MNQQDILRAIAEAQPDKPGTIATLRLMNHIVSEIPVIVAHFDELSDDDRGSFVETAAAELGGKEIPYEGGDTRRQVALVLAYILSCHVREVVREGFGIPDGEWHERDLEGLSPPTAPIFLNSREETREEK